jgi:hypothetical protein
MNEKTARIIGMLGIIGIAFGVYYTYQLYHGSDLSRVPSTRRRTQSNSQEITNPPTNPCQDARNTTSTDEIHLAPAPSPRQIQEATGPRLDGLQIYPAIQKGMRTPFGLWRYYGREVSSFASPMIPIRFWPDCVLIRRPCEGTLTLSCNFNSPSRKRRIWPTTSCVCNHIGYARFINFRHTCSSLQGNKKLLPFPF